MTGISRRLFSVLESLLMPMSAVITMAAAYFAFTHFQTFGKLAAIGVLGIICWASWSGYQQNRRRNDEWPVNLAILAASSLGIAGLAVSLFV